MKDKIKEMLAFEDLTQEEKEKRGILGRLYGPCASISVPTRNGRGYNESLWENVFEHNEIVDEMFENGGVPMELDHPTDREETDSSKIAAMMCEKPKRDKDGHLICYVDLIDTPMGRIAYALAKYGFKLGISSRGSGDIITDENGNEIVDPDTYDFTTFDLVLLPAVKDARLTMTEGLNKNVLNLKKALTESLQDVKHLNGAEYSADEKKIMTDTIEKLESTLNESTDAETKNDSTSLNENVNKQENSTLKQTEVTVEANNDGSESIIKSLQESLKTNAELEERVKSLQKELAVRDTKVTELEEHLSKSNSTIVRLTTLVQDSKEKTQKIQCLEEELKNKTQTIEKLEKRPIRESVSPVKPLRESIAKKNAELRAKSEEINSLNEQLTTLKDETTNEINSLKENLKSVEETKTNEVNSLKESLNKSKSMIESYQKLTEKIVNKYIAINARQLAVKSEDITSRLSENFTLSDVDKVCADIKSYKINVSKLPFALDSKSVLKVNESKLPNTKSIGVNDDDYVDEDTIKIINRL